MSRRRRVKVSPEKVLARYLYRMERAGTWEAMLGYTPTPTPPLTAETERRLRAAIDKENRR